MLPPNAMGRVTFIAPAGDYTIAEKVGREYESFSESILPRPSPRAADPTPLTAPIFRADRPTCALELAHGPLGCSAIGAAGSRDRVPRREDGVHDDAALACALAAPGRREALGEPTAAHGPARAGHDVPVRARRHVRRARRVRVRQDRDFAGTARLADSVCVGTGLCPPATSAPRLGSPLLRLHRDGLTPVHICTGLG